MIHPSKAFYRPGENVEIAVPGAFQARIWHLESIVADVHGHDLLRWVPPSESKRGYRVRIECDTGTAWTAFDVLHRWTDAPRYGFLIDFSADRSQFDLKWLTALHVNGLQFYDWMYRHERLLPPSLEYQDPLGRELSLQTVRRLIDSSHQRNIAAMPYTAIYGASPAFAASHPSWGLYDETGTLYDFADGFLKIMNPASGWRDHFVRECQAVLKKLRFDGIHIDQYGEPQIGFDNTGQPVDLPSAIAGTIEAVRSAIPDRAAVVFNLVHNWPIEAMRGSPVDFLYSELWSPMTSLGDLARVVTENRRISGGKMPVIAVYIPPNYDHTVTMAQAVILASGGYHLAHGEQGLYLCDPYFPKATEPSFELASTLKRLADFGVAFEEFLTFAEPVSVEATVDALLWIIPRRTFDYLVLNVLNVRSDAQWTDNLHPCPPKHHVTVRLEVTSPVEGIWMASPDDEAPAQPLQFCRTENCVTFVVPVVTTWALVWLKQKLAD